MHEVSLRKIDEVLGADAVLYAQVDDWGSSYFVVASQVKVTLTFKLVHVKTGTVLWVGRASQISQSNSGGGSLIGMLISAAVTQVANALSDPSRDLAESLNWQMFHDRRRASSPAHTCPKQTDRLRGSDESRPCLLVFGPANRSAAERANRAGAR